MKKFITIMKYYPKMIFFKIYYGNKIKVNLKCRLIINSTKIKIFNEGQINLDEKANCRENLSIVVDGGKLTIGKECFFNNNCSIMCLEKIEIGDRSTIGPNVVIVDNDHNYKDLNHKGCKTTAIKIGKNVWIGANSVILRGTQIGDNCVIAAGSIVSGNINRDTVFYQKRENSYKKINFENK